MMNKNLMRQAQELQSRLLKAQQELEVETVEASSGGGVVKVVMTGQQKAKSVKIAPEAIDPKEVELLEELVLTALNDALEKSRELAANKMSKLTGGMKIPGLM